MSEDKSKSLLEMCMDIASMPSKDPFIIVDYSGELPKELEPFLSESLAGAKGDPNTENQ